MKSNWFRNILRGLSVTSMVFIFQACYGTPQDVGYDVLIEGTVKAKSGGQPIKGIRVFIPEKNQYEFTDESGNFSFYTPIESTITVRFEDMDFQQNGEYITKDTLLTNVNNAIFLNIMMDDK